MNLMNINNIIIKNNRIRSGLHSDEYKARIKKSISSLGLSKPILINENNELVNGDLRLDIYKQLHEEEKDKLRYIKNLPDKKERTMLIKKFGEFRYNRIGYEVITIQRETQDLKNELLETWCMREHEGYRISTALDRLNILFENDDKFFKDITKHLEAIQEEIESFLGIGRDIRNGKFTIGIINMYKDKSMTTEALYNEELFHEQMIETEEIEEEIEHIEEFDLDDWL